MISMDLQPYPIVKSSYLYTNESLQFRVMIVLIYQCSHLFSDVPAQPKTPLVPRMYDNGFHTIAVSHREDISLDILGIPISLESLWAIKVWRFLAKFFAEFTKTGLLTTSKIFLKLFALNCHFIVLELHSASLRALTL